MSRGSCQCETQVNALTVAMDRTQCRARIHTKARSRSAERKRSVCRKRRAWYLGPWKRKTDEKRHWPERVGQCIFEQQEDKCSQDTDFELALLRCRWLATLQLLILHYRRSLCRSRTQRTPAVRPGCRKQRVRCRTRCSKEARNQKVPASSKEARNREVPPSSCV